MMNDQTIRKIIDRLKKLMGNQNFTEYGELNWADIEASCPNEQEITLLLINNLPAILEVMEEYYDVKAERDELHEQAASLQEEYGTLMGEWSNAMAYCGGMRVVLEKDCWKYNQTTGWCCKYCLERQKYGHLPHCVLFGEIGKKLLEKMDKMRELLEKYEWNLHDESEIANWCQECGHWENQGHKTGCKWVEAVKNEKD